MASNIPINDVGEVTYKGNPVNEVIFRGQTIWKPTPVATISGLPTTTIYESTNFELFIGGSGIVSYKFSWNNGAWSSEKSVEMNMISFGDPGMMTVMKDILQTVGTNKLRVIGKTSGGIWQTESSATTLTIVVSVKALENLHSTFVNTSDQPGLSGRHEVTVHWDQVPGVSKYVIEVSNNPWFRTDSNFNTVYHTSSTNSFVIPREPSIRGTGGEPEGSWHHSYANVYVRVKEEGGSEWPRPTGQSQRYLTHPIPVSMYHNPLYVSNKYGVSKPTISIRTDKTAAPMSGYLTLEKRTGTSGDWKTIWKSSTTAYSEFREFLDEDVSYGQIYQYRISDTPRNLYGRPTYTGLPSKVVSHACSVHSPTIIEYKNTNEVVIPIRNTMPTGNLKIDWGDGTNTEVNLDSLSGGNHTNEFFFAKDHHELLRKTWSSNADRTIKIYGDVTRFNIPYSHITSSEYETAWYASQKKMHGCSTFGSLAVTSLRGFFHSVENLQVVPSKIPTNCLDISKIFSESGSANSTKTLDVRNWDVTAVRNVSYAFSGVGFENINISNWRLLVASELTGMLTRLKNITSLDLSNVKFPRRYIGSSPTLSLPHYTCYRSMFTNCPKLKTISLPNLDTSDGRWAGRMGADISQMFYTCPALTTLTGIENWNVSRVRQSTQVFSLSPKLNLNLSNWCFREITVPRLFAADANENDYDWYKNSTNRPKWNCT